jgi:mannose-6-phosphate isomerase class I
MNELICRPKVIEGNDGYKVFHLPTHTEHFYDVHRVEFEKDVEIETKNKCHICMLVEGESLLLETGKGSHVRFNYAETFVIPAAVVKYKLTNEGSGLVKVIKAFVKDKIEI